MVIRDIVLAFGDYKPEKRPDSGIFIIGKVFTEMVITNI
jgi:hypothetical protein